MGDAQIVASGTEGRGRLWRRALAVWLSIAIAETVHGVLRGLWLTPRVGEAVAQRIGLALGSIIVLGIATMSSRWLGARSPAQRWQVGIVWCALMAGFEVLVGRARGLSAARIVAEFDPTQGGLMAFGLLLMLVAPTLGVWLRAAIGIPPN